MFPISKYFISKQTHGRTILSQRWTILLGYNRSSQLNRFIPFRTIETPFLWHFRKHEGLRISLFASISMFLPPWNTTRGFHEYNYHHAAWHHSSRPTMWSTWALCESSNFRNSSSDIWVSRIFHIWNGLTSRTEPFNFSLAFDGFEKTSYSA